MSGMGREEPDGAGKHRRRTHKSEAEAASNWNFDNQWQNFVFVVQRRSKSVFRRDGK